MSTSAKDGAQVRNGGAPIRLGRLLNVNPRPRLQRLAAAFIERHGPPRPVASQSVTILSSAARKLAETGGNLEALTPRERKSAIELFWTEMHGWRPGSADVTRWLAWARPSNGGRGSA